MKKKEYAKREKCLCSVALSRFLIIFFLQRYFIATSRELTRIDSITKAPVILHFSETIAGFVTIRAFGEQARFANVNMERVNANLRMDFHNNAANEWLGCRLELIGTLVLSSSALFMVTLARNIIDAGNFVIVHYVPMIYTY